jgi:hypothetical protein
MSLHGVHRGNFTLLFQDRRAFRVFVGKPEGKDPLGILRLYGRIKVIPVTGVEAYRVVRR